MSKAEKDITQSDRIQSDDKVATHSISCLYQ